MHAEYSTERARNASQQLNEFSRRHCCSARQGGSVRNAPAAGRLRGFFAEGFIGDEVMKELLAMLRFLGAGDTISAVASSPLRIVKDHLVVADVGTPESFYRRGRL